MPQSLRPINLRQLRREVDPLRGRSQFLRRCVLREEGTYLILLAIEPCNEQHLDSTAAIPVTLLIVRSNTSDARAKTLRDHRRKRRVILSCDGQLPFSSRGATDRADLTVGPWLFRDPSKFVFTVSER